MIVAATATGLILVVVYLSTLFRVARTGSPALRAFEDGEQMAALRRAAPPPGSVSDPASARPTHG